MRRRHGDRRRRVTGNRRLVGWPIAAAARSCDHGLMAHRRMRDPRFRRQQEENLRAPHVAPINALVDELASTAGRGWVPYVSPLYGGVNARVLNVHRDPGPKTDGRQGGSGFLWTENDAP